MSEYKGHYYRECHCTGDNECHNCGGWIPSGTLYIEETDGARYKFCSLRCFREYADMHPIDTSVGSCFITTATCKSRNLPDDCHELTTLRAFRDTFMKKDPEMKAEVDEYYKIAPVICKNIDNLENSNEVYDSIRKLYLNDAVTAVDNQELQKAHDIYKKMVLDLKSKYYK